MQRTVTYMGYKLSADGISPTEEKVEAIKSAPTLENVTQVQAFLGLLKYLIRTNFREALISRFSRFVKNREIKDSLKLGYAKIKHAKFNTLL